MGPPFVFISLKSNFIIIAARDQSLIRRLKSAGQCGQPPHSLLAVPPLLLLLVSMPNKRLRTLSSACAMKSAMHSSTVGMALIKPIDCKTHATAAK